jgi:adenine phosphoribosyltransferase
MNVATRDHAQQNLKAAVRDVLDFPQQGIVFKDITPILANPSLFQIAIDWMVSRHEGEKIDAVVGIDARGFIFAGAVANRLGIGIIPVRKKGKLPYMTESVAYDLEYGKGELEIHVDALSGKGNVIIVDDLLATGGTAAAAAKLIEKIGGQVVGIDFLIELTFLNGRARLKDYKTSSAIQY